MKNVIDEYFKWLVSFVDCHNTFPADHYEYLLNYLYFTQYRWTVINDKNRALDGRELRDRFCNGDEELFYTIDEHLPYPCSILEMLIAMSERCEFDIMHLPGGENNTYIWFWSMIDNLHLSFYTDDRYDEDSISEIVWQWIDRKFEPDGSGGLFPLEYPIEDSRDVETWGLLNRWISENYDE